jgi:hypothetical protein
MATLIQHARCHQLYSQLKLLSGNEPVINRRYSLFHSSLYAHLPVKTVVCLSGLIKRYVSAR